MLTVRLPSDLEQRLDALARRTGKTKTFHAREAILQCIDDFEDAYLAEDAYKRFKESGEKAIPLQEALKEYGLDVND